MSTELELKFAMPAQLLPQVVALLPQLGQVQQHDSSTLLNAYFDSTDNWFRRHDMGLRTRLKRGRYEQTIKLAGAQHGAMQMRPEYNLPCSGVIPQLAAFPAQIWPPQTDVAALQQQLTELFRTDFTRQSWQLSCADGSLIELVYDEGHILAGARSQPIAELELELLQGDGRQLFALARQLLQHIALRTGWQSKAARGYRLLAQQPLSLPPDIPAGLSAQINALQQTEACYHQQAEQAAPGLAVQLLSAIADNLAGHPALQQSAQQLSAKLAAGHDIFATPAYQLWLLTLSEYLYQQR
ncbi:inorganic triphosphatase [Rheinheimera pleomorphica]|uniref:CYTH domain-containing protein n=1 Tax=Rheinheimera pleomorphica TaxID=2703963 RepID=UPI001421F31D|nr:CYTH domain-containing protein [Rheinheimera pleomorphica]